MEINKHFSSQKEVVVFSVKELVNLNCSKRFRRFYCFVLKSGLKFINQFIAFWRLYFVTILYQQLCLRYLTDLIFVLLWFQMGVYLYKWLPLETWLPTDPDLVILRQWLLTSDLTSPTNQMAQQILNHINWGTSHRVGCRSFIHNSI